MTCFECHPGPGQSPKCKGGHRRRPRQWEVWPAPPSVPPAAPRQRTTRQSPRHHAHHTLSISRESRWDVRSRRFSVTRSWTGAAQSQLDNPKSPLKIHMENGKVPRAQQGANRCFRRCLWTPGEQPRAPTSSSQTRETSRSRKTSPSDTPAAGVRGAPTRRKTCEVLASVNGGRALASNSSSQDVAPDSRGIPLEIGQCWDSGRKRPRMRGGDGHPSPTSGCFVPVRHKERVF